MVVETHFRTAMVTCMREFREGSLRFQRYWIDHRLPPNITILYVGMLVATAGLVYEQLQALHVPAIRF